MKKHLKTTWAHIRRSPYQALAAISIMTLTFFVASVVVLSAAGFQTVLAWFETRPQVTAFFKDEVQSNQVDDLRTRLDKTGKVDEIKYVSKQEALTIYREQNKDDPLLLEMVTANILPASLEVSTTEIEYLGEVAQTLRDDPIVEEVIFQEDVVESLQTWTQTVRKVGLVLIGFLSTVSFLIILIIISMKVALKKAEIEILRLLGASSWYVRVPFIFEGIFYGVTGALLAWSLTYLALLYSTPLLIDFLAEIPLLPVSVVFMLALLGAWVIMGIFIGAISSLLAVRRYLH